MKKIVALFMVACMLLSVVAFSGCSVEDGDTATYTITFNDGNGGAYAPISIKHGEVIGQLPVAIVPADKEFVGWETEDGKRISEGMTFTYLNDIELTAIFNPKVFTITFSDGNGGTYTPINIKYGEIISGLPTAPAPSGEEFTGWKTADGEMIVEGVAYAYLNDIKVTAIFVPKVFTITFNDSNSGTYTPINIKYGEVISSLPVANVPADKEFVGWETEDGKRIVEGMTFTYLNDIELTAIFNPKVFTITFNDGNGGTYTPINIKYGEIISSLPVATAPIGEEFTGWKTEGGEIIVEGMTFTYLNDIELTAIFTDIEIVTYTITFNDGNGGSYDPISIEYGGVIGSLPVAITPVGMEFAGWITPQGDKIISEGMSFTYVNDLELTAIFNPKVFTITFNDSNGGTYTPININYGEVISSLPIATIPAGKEFSGWKTADGEKIVEGMTFTFLNDIELTAVLVSKVFTITFNDGNGGSYDPISVEYGGVIGSLPVAITPAGKEFSGWKTQGGKIISEGMTFTYLNDIELTAIFVAKKFTIVLQNTTKASFTEWADGTSGDKIVNVEIGGKLVVPNIKYEDMTTAQRNDHDYLFKGWFYKDKNGNEKQLDLNEAITLENLDIEEYEIVVYAKVRRQWYGA